MSTLQGISNIILALSELKSKRTLGEQFFAMIKKLWY